MERELGLMKPTAVLVNIAPAEIVDEEPPVNLITSAD